jgi:polar amino acid transport system permease protein
MVDFSLWDILRNLLLAARWTVLLSLIAFVGGGLVGLALLVARCRRARRSSGVAAYVQLFQGTPLLMQLFLAYFGLALLGSDLGLGVGGAGADAVQQRLPGRDLARLRQRHPARASGRPRRAWR